MTAAPDTPPSSHGAAAEFNKPGDLGISQSAPALPASPPEDAGSSQRKRRRTARVTRPEPGSLYDIMHDHAGESLFVIPICWPDAHAALLGAQFADSPAVRKPVPDFTCSSSRYPPRPSRIATELSKDLTDILSSKTSPFNTEPIKQIMRTFFPSTLSKPKSDVDLELRFGQHILRRAVRVAVLWKHPDGLGSSFDSATTKPTSSYGKMASSTREPCDSQSSDCTIDSNQPLANRPLLAFVNKDHLASVRRNLYRVMPGPLDGDRQNTPVTNLQVMRSRRLVPKNRDHDSYLIAVMLAIAQSQCYPPRSRASSTSSSQRSSQGSTGRGEIISPKPVFRDVPVRILCHDSDTAEFVVYKTVVTADFLRRFSDPFKAPPADALHDGGMKVDITRVPIWPVLGLKERLALAIGAEVTGEELSQLIDGDIETWESEQERRARMNNLKRRRDVFSDVFHTSFDANDGAPGRESSSPSFAGGLGLPVTSPPLSPRTPKRRRTQAINELEVC